jgi:hypothetical protein
MWLKVLKICLLVFLKIGVATTFASDTLVLKDESSSYFISSTQVEYTIDTTNSLTLDQIAQNAVFKKYPAQAFIGILENNKNHWLRITLKNESDQHLRWLIENLDAHIHIFDFYIYTSDKKIIKKSAGYGIPFSVRDYAHKNFIFDLSIKAGEVQTIYIRAQSAARNIFLFKVQTHSYFTFYSLNEYYLLGIFYGVLAIMALYNLLLYLYFKESIYVYYCIYILSCALLTLGDDGLGFQYLWPSKPQWNVPINTFAPLIFLTSFFVYSNSFLKMKENVPSLYTWINLFFIGYTLFYFADIFFLKINIGYHTFMIPFILIYIMSIVCWKKGYKPARFYIVGYSFILLHFFYLVLKNNDLVIWNNILSSYTFNLGIIMEILIFSIALMDRFKVIKNEREIALIEKEKAQGQIIDQLKENEKLKDKVNLELETKVADRTYALHEKTNELTNANKKLEELYEKLSVFASDLDIKNWELQKKVKEETKARIIAKEVSYEEFLKIFPDEDTCIRYLSEIKWEHGFVCKKCGNKKFGKGEKIFARKCTVCKYSESVTASTLFHGVKFPLNKAFYIVYTASYSSKKFTVDQLAEILELRRNTCWSFRKKIMERKELLVSTLKVKEIDNWQSLFLD